MTKCKCLVTNDGHKGPWKTQEVVVIMFSFCHEHPVSVYIGCLTSFRFSPRREKQDGWDLLPPLPLCGIKQRSAVLPVSCCWTHTAGKQLPSTAWPSPAVTAMATTKQVGGCRPMRHVIVGMAKCVCACL